MIGDFLTFLLAASIVDSAHEKRARKKNKGYRFGMFTDYAEGRTQGITTEEPEEEN